MVRTAAELKKICAQISQSFQNEHPENFKTINNNIQKIVANKKSFWANMYNDVESIQKINKIYKKIKNLEDFIFYSYYYLSQEKYHETYGFDNRYNFKKLFDIFFNWSSVYNLFNIDLEPIQSNFEIICEDIAFDFVDLYEITGVEIENFHIEIKKINI